MLGFTVAVLTTVVVLASAGYAVAQTYRFIRRKVSKKKARPEVTVSEPKSPLVELILSGVPCESVEPSPTSAELHPETGRDGASVTRTDIKRYLRRYNLKSAVLAILVALLSFGIFWALFWLTQYSEAFRNTLVNLILRLPWLLVGFIAGVVLAERDAKREEQARERMFPGRCEQNREYEAYKLHVFNMRG